MVCLTRLTPTIFQPHLRSPIRTGKYLDHQKFTHHANGKIFRNILNNLGLYTLPMHFWEIYKSQIIEDFLL